MPQSDYWFSKEGDELATLLAHKVRNFQEYTVRSGLVYVWNKNRAFYEGRIFGNSISNDIIDCGDVGELKSMSFNHFRNIIRHMLNSLMANNPAFDVSAINTDRSSRRSARIGRDLVNYYHKTKRTRKYCHASAERALVYGDGFISAEFNPAIGRITMVEPNGRFIREGDFEFDDHSPFDVFYDYSKRSKRHWDWVCYRRRRNKFDIAALFKKQQERVEGLNANVNDDLYYDFFRTNNYANETDDVFVYSAFHRACNVLPKGKYVLWAGDQKDQILLYESDNPYGEDLPIFNLSPAEYLETSFGFTEANIIRSAQMALTLATSAMLTNMNAGAVNNLWTPRGEKLDVNEIINGMNHIQSDTKPEPISFYAENPALVNMFNLCVSQMETLSGQNAVVRGNVQNVPNLKSGIAIATVINMAQEYSQALEMSYFDMLEDLYSFVLTMLKKVANKERLYEISGKSQRSSVESYTSEDLEGVSRVVVDRTNPIAKTPAGKIEIANNLLQIGKINTEQFFDVVNTGNLNVATESDERLLDYIASTKEALLAGKQVPPLPGVDHQLFIKEIHALLLDVDMTTNPENTEIVQNISNLVNAHMDLLRQGDQIASLIYGGQPPAPEAISSAEVPAQAMGLAGQPQQSAPTPMPPPQGPGQGPVMGP
jgi:hypothetical protein